MGEYVFGITCMSCEYKHLKTNVKPCITCMKEDKPGNRFPGYKAEVKKHGEKTP